MKIMTLLNKQVTDKGLCYAAMWRKHGDSTDAWGFGSTQKAADENARYFREEEGSGRSLGYGRYKTEYRMYDKNGHTVREERLLCDDVTLDLYLDPAI